MKARDEFSFTALPVNIISTYMNMLHMLNIKMLYMSYVLLVVNIYMPQNTTIVKEIDFTKLRCYLRMFFRSRMNSKNWIYPLIAYYRSHTILLVIDFVNADVKNICTIGTCTFSKLIFNLLFFFSGKCFRSVTFSTTCTRLKRWISRKLHLQLNNSVIFNWKLKRFFFFCRLENRIHFGRYNGF